MSKPSISDKSRQCQSSDYWADDTLEDYWSTTRLIDQVFGNMTVKLQKQTGSEYIPNIHIHRRLLSDLHP